MLNILYFKMNFSLWIFQKFELQKKIEAQKIANDLIDVQWNDTNHSLELRKLENDLLFLNKTISESNAEVENPMIFSKQVIKYFNEFNDWIYIVPKLNEILPF